jgi:hypothetical protein
MAAAAPAVLVVGAFNVLLWLERRRPLRRTTRNLVVAPNVALFLYTLC